MELPASCPYCGEPVDVWVDTGGARNQRYVEDCPVCCRPWDVRIWSDDTGDLHAVLTAQDG